MDLAHIDERLIAVPRQLAPYFHCVCKFITGYFDKSGNPLQDSCSHTNSKNVFVSLSEPFVCTSYISFMIIPWQFRSYAWYFLHFMSRKTLTWTCERVTMPLCLRNVVNFALRHLWIDEFNKIQSHIFYVTLSMPWKYAFDYFSK